MKVLLVNGSPNKNGCTNLALTEVEKILKEEGIETEIFWVGAKPISGCIGCGKCSETGICTFDDTVNEFAKKAKDADGFIFGTPVHYAGASGAITAFMDRLFYSAGRYLKHKPGAAVVVARRGGMTSTYDQINKYFGIAQMPIVTSCYWNMVIGRTPDDAIKDAEGLKTMRVLGSNMAYLLKCINAGKQVGINHPEDN